MSNPNYPTIPGKSFWQLIGEYDSIIRHADGTTTVREATAALMWDCWGTREDAEAKLAECLSRPPNGWRNIRITGGTQPLIDADRMRTIAADLAARTGADVEYHYHGGLTVRFGSTIRTDVDPTEEAVRAAVEEQRKAFWNQDVEELGFNSWTTHEPKGMR